MLTWLTTSDRGNRPGLVAMIPGSEAASFPGFGGRRTSSQGLLINEIRVLRVLSDSGDLTCDQANFSRSLHSNFSARPRKDEE